MSEASKSARKAAKAKISKLLSPGAGKVDASSWTPPAELEAGVKTGARPISPRAFKRGGKVKGEEAATHAGRKPRKGDKGITADTFVNRDVKEANEERDGDKHVGAFKKGGRVARANGGTMVQQSRKAPPVSTIDRMGGEPSPDYKPKFNAPTSDSNVSDEDKAALADKAGLKRGGKAKHSDLAEDKALIKKMVKPTARVARKAGGRTGKGKMNVNIIIGQHPGGAAPGTPIAPPAGLGRPPGIPVPVGAPPGGGMPMGGMPMGGSPNAMPVGPGAGAPMPMPLPRKSGGRAYPITTGSGGANARLEKIKAYGLTQSK